MSEDSLSESGDGKLRVAANLLTWNQTQPVQSNAVSVLDARLQPVSVLKDFSPNESVRSARFIGDLAYVTTFRGIDPLFVIDVSAAPHVVGKLEVPGFSTYLQPMDAGHLLAIGVDMDAAGTWESRSLQLSVFDVTNPAQPARTATARVGSAYASSEALWDNHAFNWFADEGLLAVPYSDWAPDGTQFSSAARVFAVTGTSIADKGALSMADLYVTSHDWTWRWSPWVRRTVMASDATAYVYAVSDAGIRVAAVDDLTHPLATVSFPQ